MNISTIYTFMRPEEERENPLFHFSIDDRGIVEHNTTSWLSQNKKELTFIFAPNYLSKCLGYTFDQ